MGLLHEDPFDNYRNVDVGEKQGCLEPLIWIIVIVGGFIIGGLIVSWIIRRIVGC